jgi:hypothetical protein
MGRKRRTISVVRELAARQHGVFAREQLAGLGLSLALIDHWLRKQRVEAVERGVYSFARELLAREGNWMAAVLTTGPDALLSHRSAAAHWGFRQHVGPTEITTTRKLRSRPDLLPHCLPFSADEVTVHNGIPITTPGRTLFDIAHQIPRQALDRALREMEYLRLSGGPSLPDLVERYPGRTGIRAVKRLLAEGWFASPTRSELELRFTSFIDANDLPRPERNALVELNGRRIEVDFLWRKARVVVELDGYASHTTRHSFEDDRERDRLLQLAGFRVVRVTWRQLHGGHIALARDLLSLVRS